MKHNAVETLCRLWQAARVRCIEIDLRWPAIVKLRNGDFYGYAVGFPFPTSFLHLSLIYPGLLSLSQNDQVNGIRMTSLTERESINIVPVAIFEWNTRQHVPRHDQVSLRTCFDMPATRVLPRWSCNFNTTQLRESIGAHRTAITEAMAWCAMIHRTLPRKGLTP